MELHAVRAPHLLQPECHSLSHTLPTCTARCPPFHHHIIQQHEPPKPNPPRHPKTPSETQHTARANHTKLWSRLLQGRNNKPHFVLPRLLFRFCIPAAILCDAFHHCTIIQTTTSHSTTTTTKLPTLLIPLFSVRFFSFTSVEPNLVANIYHMGTKGEISRKGDSQIHQNHHQLGNLFSNCTNRASGSGVVSKESHTLYRRRYPQQHRRATRGGS